MSDSEQCSNRLELDLISLLVNFSCELGQIITRYDFLWVRWVILSNVRTYLNLISKWPNNFRWYSFVFERTQSRLVSLVVNFSCVLGANNDQIWLSYGLDKWFWAMFKATWTLPIFTFGQRFKWIGENRWIFWERFWWYSFVFKRTQSRLVGK